MKIKINGKEETLDKQISLQELVEMKGLDKNKIVIEKNREVIPGKNLAETQIQEGDSIEIISFIGGGK